MHRRHLLQGLAAAAAPPPPSPPHGATCSTRPRCPARWRRARRCSPSPAPASRVVAAGQRGHVLWSDDAGRRWQQAEVPVSADPTGLHFPTPSTGWAVGHDGVVLHSADGGRRWQRQLDGPQPGPVLLAQAQALGEEKVVAEARRFADQGAENPFLDCWFDDARNGHVVGAFGLLLRTQRRRQQLGVAPARRRQPQGLHLYAVRRIGGELTVAGEQGPVLKLDRASDRFVALALPYHGTLFGVVGHDVLLATACAATCCAAPTAVALAGPR